MTITNGTIKYGQTVKTGDYENKRGDVELTFTVAEGEDIHEKLNHVKDVAHHHLHSLLNPGKVVATISTAKPAAKEEIAEKPAAKAKAAPKLPVKPVVTDISAIDEEMEAATVGKVPAFLAKEVEAQNAKAAEDNIDDLLGGGEPAKEITDKELTDATQKCQSDHKNAPAIRKILGELGVKVPPGRIIDLTQDKRQTYLDKLKEVKPLA